MTNDSAPSFVQAALLSDAVGCAGAALPLAFAPLFGFAFFWTGVAFCLYAGA